MTFSVQATASRKPALHKSQRLSAAAMGNLPNPIRSKLFNRYGNEQYQVCVCAMQGFRMNMEDSHCVQLAFLNHADYALFAIFDGHNGRKASHYLTKQLMPTLDALASLSDTEAIQNAILAMDEAFCASPDGENGSTIVFALSRTVYHTRAHDHDTTDTDTTESLASTQCSQDKASTEHISDDDDDDTQAALLLNGHTTHPNENEQKNENKNENENTDRNHHHAFSSHTTTTTTATHCNNHNSKKKTATTTIKEYEIRIFWAGDSRALLIKTSHAASDDNTRTLLTQTPAFDALTVDHRPDHPSEKLRIQAANGLIINNRVDSKLAVSRAFGDNNLKDDACRLFSLQRVTSLMEHTLIRAKPNDTLLLFCDGLVEYLDNHALVRTLYRHLPQYEDPVYALGYLFDEVLDNGSRDNMSAVMVRLCDGTDYGTHGKQKTFLPGPLYLSRHDRKYVDAYMRNARDHGHADSPKLRRAAYRQDLKLLRKFGASRVHGGKDRASSPKQYEKAIIAEIEQVIRDIDRHAQQQQPEESNVDSERKEECVPLSQGDSASVAEEHDGSTEVIDDDEHDENTTWTPTHIDVSMENKTENRNGTPVFSDEEAETETEEEEDMDVHSLPASELSRLQKTLTITPIATDASFFLRRTDSIVGTPSPTNHKQRREFQENVSPSPELSDGINTAAAPASNSNSNSSNNNARKRTFSIMNTEEQKHNHAYEHTHEPHIDAIENESHDTEAHMANEHLRCHAAKRQKSNGGEVIELHST